MRPLGQLIDLISSIKVSDEEAHAKDVLGRVYEYFLSQSGEGEIRKNLIEADLVDCMFALPSQFFYSTQISACLWFIARVAGIYYAWRS